MARLVSPNHMKPLTWGLWLSRTSWLKVTSDCKRVLTLCFFFVCLYIQNHTHDIILLWTLDYDIICLSNVSSTVCCTAPIFPSHWLCHFPMTKAFSDRIVLPWPGQHTQRRIRVVLQTPVHDLIGWGFRCDCWLTRDRMSWCPFNINMFNSALYRGLATTKLVK